MEVPCNDVKTIFKFSLPSMSNVPFFIEAFQKASSTSAPILVINSGFALKLISEKSNEFTSSIILLS